jgi:hypothetical protein
MNKHATIEELLEVVFLVRSLPMLYTEDTSRVDSKIKCKKLKLGRGQAYDRSSD